MAVARDKHADGPRPVIGNFFCRIKDQRRVATRCGKTARHYAAMVMIFRILVWLQL